MKTSRMVAFAAILSATTAVPAFAAWQQAGSWDEIGSVDVNRSGGRAMQTFDLGGPIDGLRLRAEDSDARCDSIKATFGNGNTRQIFSGRLQQNRVMNVNLPGDNRNVQKLTFNCRAMHWRGATIRIMADIGSHQAEWRKNPNFGKAWAHVFNWGSNAVNNWQYLGDATFVGSHDSDSTFAGWRGHGTDAVALKPLDASARCSRVTAMFANGRSQNLSVNNGDFIRQGQYYKLDLPGNGRNLTSLDMRCRATDAHSVKVQIFTSK